jgi:hypothetical protein
MFEFFTSFTKGLSWIPWKLSGFYYLFMELQACVFVGIMYPQMDLGAKFVTHMCCLLLRDQKAIRINPSKVNVFSN